MKKLITFGIVFFLIGCSDDDSKSGSDSLVGKWYFKETIINNDLVIPYDDNEICGKDYIEFTADGTFRMIDVWDCEEDLMAVGTYTVDGNNLTIFNGDASISTIITKRTTQSLKFQYSFDYDDDGIMDVVTESYDR